MANGYSKLPAPEWAAAGVDGGAVHVVLGAGWRRRSLRCAAPVTSPAARAPPAPTPSALHSKTQNRLSYRRPRAAGAQAGGGVPQGALRLGSRLVRGKVETGARQKVMPCPGVSPLAAESISHRK